MILWLLMLMKGVENDKIAILIFFPLPFWDECLGLKSRQDFSTSLSYWQWPHPHPHNPSVKDKLSSASERDASWEAAMGGRNHENYFLTFHLYKQALLVLGSFANIETTGKVHFCILLFVSLKFNKSGCYPNYKTGLYRFLKAMSSKCNGRPKRMHIGIRAMVLSI